MDTQNVINSVQAPLATQTSMDLTAPIDIQAVIGAVKQHQDLLVAIDMLDAGEVLKHAYGIPGVTDSITLGRVEGGAVSSMYNGVFIGRTANGKVVPRTLTVRPIKIEEADEPERYRRTYITEVRGGLYDGGHPFEVWLIAHVLQLASQRHQVCLRRMGHHRVEGNHRRHADRQHRHRQHVRHRRDDRSEHRRPAACHVAQPS